MFKKTRVRSILELLGRGLSAREISKSLGVSRNTVSEVQALYLQSGKSGSSPQYGETPRFLGFPHFNE